MQATALSAAQREICSGELLPDFLHLAERREPIDLLRIGREAKAARTCDGVPPSRAVGNVFFTLPGSDGFVLHMLQIAESSIEHEIIEPISTRFSTRACSVEAAACHALTSRLRPSCFFTDIGAFHHQRLTVIVADGRFHNSSTQSNVS